MRKGREWKGFGGGGKNGEWERERERERIKREEMEDGKGGVRKG